MQTFNRKKSFAGTAILVALSSLMLLLACQSSNPKDQAKYGALSVKEGKLLDSDGNQVQLKGISTMGLQWYGGIVNEAAFDALAKDWQSDVVRLALYVGEDGYAKKPELKDLVKKGVELAIKRKMYVIIDWHVLNPGNPNDPIYAGAKDFFAEMSKTYGQNPNVIYEIMNEPNGTVDWAKDLKPYAQTIVDTIRQNDPDNLILIGSGTWSQDVDQAAADPVKGTNLAYTFHFYSGTHGKDLQAKVDKAIASGAAVFCSEWGTSEASGTGGPYIDKANEWLKFLDERKISWINWSLNNKNETSALLKGLLTDYVEGKGNVVLQAETPLEPAGKNASGVPAWTFDELSVSGNYVRAKLRGEADPLYGTKIAGFDFEKEGLKPFMIPDDSGLKPTLSLGKAESQALSFSADWSGEKVKDGWSTAPRLKANDANTPVGKANAIEFDFYIEEGQKLSGPFEITPILQYPPSWWAQGDAVKFDYDQGTTVGKLRKFHGMAKLKLDPSIKVNHLLLVVAGNGTGYKGNVMVDNIFYSEVTNGDGSQKAVVAKDDPGIFTKLPWDFETGGRQGWVVTEDSPAKVKPSIIKAETNALGFSYKWENPGPSDAWNAAPRLSSSFIEVPAKNYKTLSLDFYIESTKAAGALQVQPIVQSPQHGYWFQLDAQTVDFAKGSPVAGGMLKYNLTFKLTSNGNAMKDDAVLRNLVLITIGLKTDYSGKVLYDNITLK